MSMIIEQQRKRELDEEEEMIKRALEISELEEKERLIKERELQEEQERLL